MNIKKAIKVLEGLSKEKPPIKWTKEKLDCLDFTIKQLEEENKGRRPDGYLENNIGFNYERKNRKTIQ